MGIDAKLVKTLREKTGAGMMDCKKALVDSNGDLNKAVDNLRKSGIAKAEKKRAPFQNSAKLSTGGIEPMTLQPCMLGTNGLSKK